MLLYIKIRNGFIVSSTGSSLASVNVEGCHSLCLFDVAEMEMFSFLFCCCWPIRQDSNLNKQMTTYRCPDGGLV
jgi:hypothetical protein